MLFLTSIHSSIHPSFLPCGLNNGERPIVISQAAGRQTTGFGEATSQAIAPHASQFTVTEALMPGFKQRYREMQGNRGPKETEDILIMWLPGGL